MFTAPDFQCVRGVPHDVLFDFDVSDDGCLYVFFWESVHVMLSCFQGFLS